MGNLVVLHREPRDIDDPHQIVRKASQDVGPKEMALGMRVTLSTLYRMWTPDSGAYNPLQRAGLFLRILAEHGAESSLMEAIRYLARCCGGAFVASIEDATNVKKLMEFLDGQFDDE